MAQLGLDSLAEALAAGVGGIVCTTVLYPLVRAPANADTPPLLLPLPRPHKACPASG